MPKLPGPNDPPDQRLLPTQLIERLEQQAAALRRQAELIEELAWQLTMYGVRQPAKAYRNPKEIPF